MKKFKYYNSNDYAEVELKIINQIIAQQMKELNKGDVKGAQCMLIQELSERLGNAVAYKVYTTIDFG